MLDIPAFAFPYKALFPHLVLFSLLESSKACNIDIGMDTLPNELVQKVCFAYNGTKSLEPYSSSASLPRVQF